MSKHINLTTMTSEWLRDELVLMHQRSIRALEADDLASMQEALNLAVACADELARREVRR